MHHGAGSSGLTFAVVTAEIRKHLPEAGVLSLDTREHGETTVRRATSTTTTATTTAEGGDTSNDDNIIDMRLETLSRDLVAVVRLTQERMQWNELPDIVLVGHSLGGAVVTDVAKNGELGAKVLAYAVLDVVEGILRYCCSGGGGHAYEGLISLIDLSSSVFFFFLQDPPSKLCRAWRRTWPLGPQVSPA